MLPRGIFKMPDGLIGGEDNEHLDGHPSKTVLSITKMPQDQIKIDAP